MTQAKKSLAKMKKANKLVQLAFRKNGPKSFKQGQGALLNALLEDGELSQRKLVQIMGIDRAGLKTIVKKAERNGFIEIKDETKEDKTYTVVLTSDGKALAEKRAAAHDAVAADILDCLNDEEMAQLEAISEKIIVSCKEKGINGKKKGRKHHKHGRKHGHKHGKCCKRH